MIPTTTARVVPKSKIVFIRFLQVIEALSGRFADSVRSTFSANVQSRCGKFRSRTRRLSRRLTRFSPEFLQSGFFRTRLGIFRCCSATTPAGQKHGLNFIFPASDHVRFSAHRRIEFRFRHHCRAVLLKSFKTVPVLSIPSLQTPLPLEFELLDNSTYQKCRFL